MRPHVDHNSRACVLRHVRQAIFEEGHSVTSIAAHIGVAESYVSRVLNDESGLGVRFIMGLPKPVLKRLLQLACEYFGAVVTWPATDKAQALQMELAAKEFELKMLKASVHPIEERKVG